MTKDTALAFLQASVIHLEKLRSWDTLNLTFDKQEHFITAKGRLKCAFCTRRAGKTEACCAYAIRECLYNPGSNVLYLALTRKSAKSIMWPKLLKMLKKLKIPHHALVSELSIEFENGSKIFLSGANANSEEMEKLLGMSYKLVIIDEGASFRIDQKKLVYDILRPATADVLGTIVMIGTPSDIMVGLFYDVSTGKEKGWDVYKWSARDNPYVAANWDTEIKDLIDINPEIVHTAGFKRHYLGEYAIDSDNLVYKWSSTMNAHDGFDILPINFIYVLGVDLGNVDDCAFTLMGFSPHEDITYEILSFKKSNCDFTDVAEVIKQFEREYNIHEVVIDGANKQGVEEMIRRKGLHLKAADKQDKNTFIELMNSEMLKGKIKTVVEDCQPLVLERSILLKKWDEFKRKWIEDPKFPNHGCDSALYAWRYCYAYIAEKTKKIDENTTEYEDHLIEQELEEIEYEEEVEDNTPWWER